MGFIAKLLNTEQRTMSLAELDAMLDRSVGGVESGTGLYVGPDIAMTSAVVYACVNVLAQTIASLPLLVYRRLPGGGKERNENHPLYSILHDQPNPEMTAYELRAALVGHVCLWGNAYCEIERSDTKVNGLWPLRPDKMSLARDESNRLLYVYTLPNGQKKPFAFENIMHWRGLSGNGIIGYSPIAQAAEAIGVDLATRQYGAKFFGNNSQPGGILTHPGKLSVEAAQKVKSQWEAAHRGLNTSQRVAVLEEGITWTTIGIPPEQAQFLETRRYERSEIAALYRIPLHMINDLERATFSNIEHQSLEYVKYTLVPWLVQIEQAIYRDLFQISAGKRANFAEHLVDGLLRGDIQSRYQAYSIAHSNGWLCADEIRGYENLNPLPDGAGQKYWMPMNMMVMGEPRPAPAVPKTLPPTNGSGQDKANPDGQSSVNGTEATKSKEAL